MRFEYKPIFLKEWVKKEITDKSNSNGLDSAGIQNRLERLRGVLSIIREQSDNVFLKWVEELGARDSVLLPFVYKDVHKKFQKEQMIIKMASTAKSKRQLFYNLIEQCYSTNNFNPFWSIVKVGFENNQNAIVRNWQGERVEIWQEFVKVKYAQATYICDKINNKNLPLDLILQDYFINKSHKIYEEVVIEMFSNGTKSVYQNENNLFIHFLNKSDTVKVQLLVSGFIKSKCLYELEVISVKILEKMGTYKKQPMLWANVEESLKIEFHQWYLRKNIREFFSGINKEHERFVYWEKFVPKMQDALVIEKEDTILFYFNDVVIMEVLGTGAVYVYNIITFEREFGEKVNNYRESLENARFKVFKTNSFNLRRSMLMNPNSVVPGGRLSHYKGWQKNFDNFLSKRLNWEVNHNAILQERKDDITI